MKINISMVLTWKKRCYPVSVRNLKKHLERLFSIRPLVKFACAREFVGDTERRTAAYSNVREDSSIGSTSKLPAEVELHKRSIIDTLLSQNNILISH